METVKWQEHGSVLEDILGFVASQPWSGLHFVMHFYLKNATLTMPLKTLGRLRKNSWTLFRVRCCYVYASGTMKSTELDLCRGVLCRGFYESLTRLLV